ncbi:hypothetical protein ESA94_19780 [Lacibacter luteus]|uniref:Uncharacterized protein n=1 Tax=Lacibacter luteus TaxID=2508719 RepID=A0A4Q1CE74_9BACT|nr:hypothetical protein [Lacibacter luteus]RXK57762.1 hypothetical protein ESA94_19780 [Lacibacter luteus]
MKHTFRSVFTLFMASLLFLVSCKKPVEPQQPGGDPGPMPGLSHKYRITADALPGLPNQPIANIFAKFDVKNAQDELVVNNKLVAISYNGKFVTEEMELPAGSYRISKLMIVSGTGNVLYAVPVTNSAKAAGVSKPLAYPMVLPAATSLDIASEFLKVEASDKAVDFGYAADEFGTGSTPVEEALSIKIKTSIKVGDVLYDSIPSSLVYRTFSATNELLSVKFISLAAGTNIVQLDKTAAQHDFIVQKWGRDYTKRIAKTDIRTDAVYVFGEEKEAKKLRSEITSRWDGNQYKAESKNSYLYNGKGQLLKIEYMLKKASDGSPFIAKSEMFEYANDKVEKINAYGENNVFTGATLFGYNAAGKVNRITEDILNGTKTDVAVTYHGANADGISEISLRYSYSHTSIIMNYYQRWNTAGNRFSENSQTSNGNNEGGEYSYDHNINPYAHMNWPNLFLSNTSKNNLVAQQRSYYGSYPTNVAYSFEYKYDNEGYPIELVRRYKSYLTGQHLFTTKTVYNY